MSQLRSSTLASSLTRTKTRQASLNADRPAGERLKRGFDVSAAVLSLLFLLPLLAAVGLLVLVAQGRPVFIGTHRVGRGGKLFPCFKFRSMARNADEMLRDHLAADPAARDEWEQTRKLKQDPRITRLGHILRKSSVDELPQLINILRGDMSLVGPRPIVPDEIDYYGTRIQHYYRVRPGLTGSWQVNGRNDVSYVQRVQLDTDYVTNRTFGMDVMIIVKTLPAVMRSKGSY